MRHVFPLVVVTAIVAVAGSARAQNVPFFYAQPTAFTPTIGVVQGGAVNDVQAIVSPDRKYVTLNVRAETAAIQSIKQFTFQNGTSPTSSGTFGFVGSPQFIRAMSGKSALATKGPIDPSSVVSSSPTEILENARPTILDRQGMTLIGPLGR